MQILKGADTDDSGAINYTGKFRLLPLVLLNYDSCRVLGVYDGLANLPQGGVP